MYDNYVAISDANKNFSSVVKKCDKYGEVIVFKNNKPVYVLKSIKEKNKEMNISDSEKIDIASKRILKKYHKAFEDLAK